MTPIGLFILTAGLVILITLVIVVLVELAVRLYVISFRPIEVERVVIGQIASIVRQNLPLAAGVALAADSEIGRPAINLRRIARFLGQGLPLAESLRKAMPYSSALTQSLLAAGEKSGQLAAALDLAEENLVDTAFHRPQKPRIAFTYLILMLIATTTVTSGLMIAIVPKFKEIFKDYHVKLPGITTALINFCTWVIDGSTPPPWVFATPVPPWVFAIPAVCVAAFLYYRPRRWQQPRWTSRVADRIRWRTPVLRGISVNHDMRAALQIMRVAVGSGMDLATAVRLAADTDVNICLRASLVDFANLLQSGVNLRQAAKAAQLGEVASIALAAGQRSGNLDAGLRYAIDYHDAFGARAAAVVRSLVVPLVVFVAAIGVGFVILATFMPLIALISSVNGSTW